MRSAAAFPADCYVPPVRSCLCALVCLLATLACDRRVREWIPAEQEPPPPERPVRIPGLASPVPRAALAPAPDRAPDAATNAAPDAEPIRGRIEVASGTELPSNGVLFIIARAPAGGPPLAVQRLADVRFPLDFAIGPDDAMIEGRPFAGPMLLSARLDSDGDPLTSGPGDPQAAAADTLEPGASGVTLKLATP